MTDSIESRCGAATRGEREGRRCRAWPVGGRFGLRCRMHGGTSPWHLLRVVEARRTMSVANAAYTLWASEWPAPSISPARGWSRDYARWSAFLRKFGDRIPNRPVPDRPGGLLVPSWAPVQGLGFPAAEGEGFGWPTSVHERQALVRDGVPGGPA